uniref:Guanine nucleotide-binding protein subunit beta-like protein n=1 Tax=Neobodo designis TaxID=312471 RepID=A0A7S1LY50_NEODS|mmetsp:Transcript_3033/g.9447  ORF Transcript_3033/g.9447 Transcript_3033/m.9447 type:complete len:385 (+) Transcript_3033:40-1194(+)
MALRTSGDDAPEPKRSLSLNRFSIEDKVALAALNAGRGKNGCRSKRSTDGATKGLRQRCGDIREFKQTSCIGHSSRVKCLAIAPGERECASCGSCDVIVEYQSLTTSSHLGSFVKHEDALLHAVFSPCGNFLATTSRDNTLVLWDVATQAAMLTFEHSKVVICCAFSPSSKFIATGCQDTTCRVWRCDGVELATHAGHTRIPLALCFSPDEQYVVSASADKTLQIWSAAEGKTECFMAGHEGIILACNYNAAGDRIVSNDERSVRVWSAPQGQLLRTIMVDDLIKLRNPPPNKKQSWTLSCLAPKTFPRHIVVASNNRMVFVIDMESGEEVLSVDTKAPVYCLAPGHRSLVAYGDSFGNVYFLKLEAFDEEEPLDDRPGGADWA